MALEEVDRGLTSDGRALVKRDILGADRGIERKMAGWSWARHICEG